MGLLGARGCFLARRLGIVQTPLYSAFSRTNLSLSLLASSSQYARSRPLSFFQAVATSFKTTYEFFVRKEGIFRPTKLLDSGIDANFLFVTYHLHFPSLDAVP